MCDFSNSLNMPPVTCALCFESISRSLPSVTSGAPCKHSFHEECLRVKLKGKSHDIVAYTRDECPSCNVTDVTIKKLLEAINLKLDGLKTCEKKVDKLIENFGTLREDLKELKAAQKKTDADVASLGQRLDAVESRAVEAKTALSIADETVLLRAACDQVSNQLLVSGLPETGNDDAKLLATALTDALETPLEPGVLVDAYRVGKRVRAKGVQREGGSAGARSLVIVFNSKDFCKKLINAKKNKPNLTAKEIDRSLADKRIYVNHRHPVQLYQLRDRVLQAFPQVQRKHVWIADAAVFMRKSEDCRPIKILPSTDLQKLFT